jgi:hypothetical protein
MRRSISAIHTRTSMSPLQPRRTIASPVLCGLYVYVGVLCIADVSSFSSPRHYGYHSRALLGKVHHRLDISSTTRPHRHLSNQYTATTTTTGTATRRYMSLIPLPVDELARLVATGAPTASQYSSYWGRTKQEQYGRFLESSIVSFLGVFFSYFLSFVLGGFIATLFGCLFVFYGVLSPEFKAYQRNWEFLGGRPLVDPWTVEGDPERAGLYGALFLGRIGDVCVVEDSEAVEEFDLETFSDYTMETDELERFTGQPYLLRVGCVDSSGRDLQVHARLSEEYLDLRPGMPITGILLSVSPKFTRLAALTDFYVPAAECWIGDYPYLDRAELEALLAEDDQIWNALQDEEQLELPEDVSTTYDDDYYDDDDDDDYYDDNADDDVPTNDSDRESSPPSKDPVYARRRKRAR